MNEKCLLLTLSSTVIYEPTNVANKIDEILTAANVGGSSSFALWLFSSGTDFGFWGGTLFLGSWKPLVPSYDFGAPVDEAGVVRPLFAMLQTVLQKHGAIINTTLPPAPPVKAFGTVGLIESVTLWDALTTLAPNPVHHASVLTMEELGQGYGYVVYSAPLPAYVVQGGVSGIGLAGMRDNANIYLDKHFHQSCGVGAQVDEIVCGAAVSIANPTQLDILTENFGRVTGGYEDSQSVRGIDRWVQVNEQTLSNWTMSSLPLDNINVLDPLFKQHAKFNLTGPTFLRGTFTVDAPADTFLHLLGWQKGQAFVNGHNIARYWGHKGPQYSFYVPAGYLVTGQNEVVLLETSGVNATMTVEFKKTHYYVGNVPGLPPQHEHKTHGTAQSQK